MTQDMAHLQLSIQQSVNLCIGCVAANQLIAEANKAGISSNSVFIKGTCPLALYPTLSS